MAEVPAGIDDRMNGRCILEAAVVVTPGRRAEVGRYATFETDRARQLQNILSTQKRGIEVGRITDTTTLRAWTSDVPFACP